MLPSGYCNQHFAIIANGNFLFKEIILEAIQDKLVVALDGAANKLMGLGIQPHIILGDFDSISDASRAYFGIRKTFKDLAQDDPPYAGKQGTTIIPVKNQQLTDLVKAMRFCEQQKALSITLICAVGGRLDHHEGTMQALRSEYKKTRPILLHTEQQTIQFAKDETKIINGECKDAFGIVSFPEASFSSSGFVYDVQDFHLPFGSSRGICNQLQQNQASVAVTGEALIMMPPQLAAQREFMKKTEAERLRLLLRDALLSR